MPRKKVSISDSVADSVLGSKAQAGGDAKATIHPVTINMPPELHDLVRLVAVGRAKANRKGRPSVSAVIVELVQQHADELDKEWRKAIL